MKDIQTMRIEMPRLSDSIVEGTLTRWVCKAGSKVKLGEHIADVETDKTNMEILSPVRGTLTSLCVKEGTVVQVGELLAELEPSKKLRKLTKEDIHSPKTPNGIQKVTPLARRMAADMGIDPNDVLGSGPRGKVMARDIIRSEESPTYANLPAVQKIVYEDKITPASFCTSGYYVYNFQADMSQLAAISAPIAVQSEKLLGSRYCLFDYVVRAAIKGFLSDKVHGGHADVMMVIDRGKTTIPVPDANKKNIYHIACERRDAEQGIKKVTPTGYQANLVICDTGIGLDELTSTMTYRPACMIALGGTSPKANMEAGRPVHRLMLPVTLYIDEASLHGDVASRLTGEFKTLLENPVLLLF